jgi:hypothetical protein
MITNDNGLLNRWLRWMINNWIMWIMDEEIKDIKQINRESE